MVMGLVLLHSHRRLQAGPNRLRTLFTLSADAGAPAQDQLALLHDDGDSQIWFACEKVAPRNLLPRRPGNVYVTLRGHLLGSFPAEQAATHPPTCLSVGDDVFVVSYLAGPPNSVLIHDIRNGQVTKVFSEEFRAFEFDQPTEAVLRKYSVELAPDGTPVVRRITDHWKHGPEWRSAADITGEICAGWDSTNHEFVR
jgi:hypothetical protein